jgi:hypothetical protein
VPFLRLTRDRRGIENTFLMHADRPGDRPRLLYWYRTAPGITLGRLPLDEDAIRTIEEQHPDIDFDWPAILALSEVMTPEDEVAPRPQPREQREQRRERRPKRESDSSGDSPRPQGGDADSASAREHSEERVPDDVEVLPSDVVEPQAEGASEPTPPPEAASSSHYSGLVDQLAGREIASRLRGRYAEIAMRIRGADEATRASLMKLAEALDPDTWDTPEAVLQGVSNADGLFEKLRAALAPSKS